MCASERPGLSCREAQLTTLADLLARRADAAESALAASREREQVLRSALEAIRNKANVGPFSPPREGDPPWYNALVKVGKMAEIALADAEQAKE